jgi:hypothetical protein
MILTEFILAFREKAAELKGRCFYCGVQTDKGCKQSAALFQTMDHVVPKSAGTKHVDGHANRVVCCRKCNDLKEDLTLFEFKRRSGMVTFFAETVLGVLIDELDDIQEVTRHTVHNRKVEGRTVKFNGKKVVRAVQIPLYFDRREAIFVGDPAPTPPPPCEVQMPLLFDDPMVTIVFSGSPCQGGGI